MFYDDKGEKIGTTTFKPTEDYFYFKQGAYKIDVLNASEDDFNVFPFPLSWVWRKRKFFYNINYQNPYIFRKGEILPPISPKDLNKLLESDVLVKLNTPKKKLNINWKYVIIGVVGLIIIAYLLSGHKLF